MKIFLKNINKNIKNIKMENVNNTVEKIKLLPAYSKEWKIIAYFYNKNNLKTVSMDYLTINNFIRNYFNLFIKKLIFNNRLIFSSFGKKIKKLYKRENQILNKIWVSEPEIKYNNNITKITLFVINRHKLITKKKFFYLNKILLTNYIKKLYKKYYQEKIMNKYYSIISKYLYNKTYFSTIITKKKFMKFKFYNLYLFLNLKNLYLEKLIKEILLNSSKKYLEKVRKYEHLHNLNQYKLNQSILLPKLSNIIKNITGKKVEYNIINLKSFVFHPDIFTNILAKLISRKKRITLILSMAQILKKVKLSKKNAIKSGNILTHKDTKFLNKFNNLNLISNIKDDLFIDNVINKYNKDHNNKKAIHNTIFNSIHYKQLGGIRIEVKGRLTKRYRADRAVYRFRSKGGLRNSYASYKNMSAILYRGNINSNSSYSLSKSKRRVGSFAVKGWIGGK